MAYLVREAPPNRRRHPLQRTAHDNNTPQRRRPRRAMSAFVPRHTATISPLSLPLKTSLPPPPPRLPCPFPLGTPKIEQDNEAPVGSLATRDLSSAGCLQRKRSRKSKRARAQNKIPTTINVFRILHESRHRPSFRLGGGGFDHRLILHHVLYPKIATERGLPKNVLKRGKSSTYLLTAQKLIRTAKLDM